MPDKSKHPARAYRANGLHRVFLIHLPRSLRRNLKPVHGVLPLLRHGGQGGVPIRPSWLYFKPGIALSLPQILDSVLHGYSPRVGGE